MLRNYFEVDENTSVTGFLKEINEKKNSQYIILDTDKGYFVDLRNIALNVTDSGEKLKNIKKTLSKCDGDTDLEHLEHMIRCGDIVIETNKGVYDFLDAIDWVLEQEFDFLGKPLSSIDKKEIYALEGDEKISTAKKILLDNKINILPIIDSDLNIVGEVRTIDFLASDLFSNNASGKGGFYNERYKESAKNMRTSNLMNSKPHLMDKNSNIRDAVKLMSEKSLSSIIITDSNKLYSVISYKDVFKIIRDSLSCPNYSIEFVGSSNLYEDEFDIIEKAAKKSMEKISKMSEYNNLKITFKVLGNTLGSHQKKIHMKFLLSVGKKVISIDKEISTGTSDEVYNDKKKDSWNTPQMASDAFKSLENIVKSKKNKLKR